MHFKHSDCAAISGRAFRSPIGVLIGLRLALDIRLLFFVAELELALHLKVSLVDVETFTEEAGIGVLGSMTLQLA